MRKSIQKLGCDVFTPPSNASPIVSFHHGIEVEKLADALKKESIAVTLREGRHLMRVGVAMFNNRSDIDRLLGVMSKMV